MKITEPGRTLALDPIPTVIYYIKVTAHVSVPPTQAAMEIERRLYQTSNEQYTIKNAQVTQIEELAEDG